MPAKGDFVTITFWRDWLPAMIAAWLVQRKPRKSDDMRG
jgi:hypothetical protein